LGRNDLTTQGARRAFCFCGGSPAEETLAGIISKLNHIGNRTGNWEGITDRLAAQVVDCSPPVAEWNVLLSRVGELGSPFAAFEGRVITLDQTTHDHDLQTQDFIHHLFTLRYHLDTFGFAFQEFQNAFQWSVGGGNLNSSPSFPQILYQTNSNPNGPSGGSSQGVSGTGPGGPDGQRPCLPQAGVGCRPDRPGNDDPGAPGYQIGGCRRLQEPNMAKPSGFWSGSETDVPGSCLGTEGQLGNGGNPRHQGLGYSQNPHNARPGQPVHSPVTVGVRPQPEHLNQQRAKGSGPVQGVSGRGSNDCEEYHVQNDTVQQHLPHSVTPYHPIQSNASRPYISIFHSLSVPTSNPNSDLQDRTMTHPQQPMGPQANESAEMGEDWARVPRGSGPPLATPGGSLRSENARPRASAFHPFSNANKAVLQPPVISDPPQSLHSSSSDLQSAKSVYPRTPQKCLWWWWCPRYIL